MNTLNERLRYLLKELNITQRQFAQKINLDPGYFSKILSGKVSPPPRILLLIENVFKINPNWLHTGEGEIFQTPIDSIAKRQVLESIDELNDEQIQAVFSFIQYLNNKKE